MPATIAPPVRSQPDRLGLDDDDQFLTIHRVPVLDAHEPITKTVKDQDHPNADKDGVVVQSMTCAPSDLATAARNSNRRAASGRPAILQLGHSQFKDRPEAFLPKAIGFADNFAVGEFEGKPTLFADLHYRREFRQDALSHPRLSVERSGWSDPSLHAITAIALIRRPPERDLPFVPYQAERVPDQLVCYGRERDLSSPTVSGPVGFAAWLRGLGLTETLETRRRFETIQRSLVVRPDDPLPLIRAVERRTRDEYLSWAGGRGLKPSNPKTRDAFERSRLSKQR
jgi:hypothetical protein